MPHEAVVTTLKSLKLFGMAKAVDELAAQGSPAYAAAQPVLKIYSKPSGLECLGIRR